MLGRSRPHNVARVAAMDGNDQSDGLDTLDV